MLSHEIKIEKRDDVYIHMQIDHVNDLPGSVDVYSEFQKLITKGRLNKLTFRRLIKIALGISLHDRFTFTAHDCFLTCGRLRLNYYTTVKLQSQANEAKS